MANYYDASIKFTRNELYKDSFNDFNKILKNIINYYNDELRYLSLKRLIEFFNPSFLIEHQKRDFENPVHDILFLDENTVLINFETTDYFFVDDMNLFIELIDSLYDHKINHTYTYYCFAERIHVTTDLNGPFYHVYCLSYDVIEDSPIFANNSILRFIEDNFLHEKINDIFLRLKLLNLEKQKEIDTFEDLINCYLEKKYPNEENEIEIYEYIGGEEED